LFFYFSPVHPFPLFFSFFFTERGKNRKEGFWGNFGPLEKIGLSQLNWKRGKKKEWKQINSNFGMKICQRDFFGRNLRANMPDPTLKK